MDWDAVGAIGEILGAGAVVISILYLAKQINANTRSMKANAGFQATHSWAEYNQNNTLLSDDQLSSLAETYDSSASWNETPQNERTRAAVSTRALFQKLEGQFFLYKYGNLDEGLWGARSSWAAGLIKIPFYTMWWDIEKKQRIYSEEFIAVIESAEAIEVSRAILYGDQESDE